MLLNAGYEPVIVSGFVRSSRYIAFNLTARKKLDNGTIDTVMVKMKISLHPITSLAEAAIFCRDEIASVKKFFNQVPPDVKTLTVRGLGLDSVGWIPAVRDHP